MNKLLKSQNGFSAVEVSLAVLIVLMVGGIGYMVYHNDHKDTRLSATNSSTTQQLPKPNSHEQTSRSTTVPSDATVVVQRQKYIDRYVNANSNQNYTAAYYIPLYQNGYISQTLDSKIQSQANYDTSGPEDTANPAYDLFICSNVTPTSYTYGPATVNSSADTATLPVSIITPNASTPTTFIANWVKTDNVWHLNGSTCPQN
jgi:hypothetical protein